MSKNPVYTSTRYKGMDICTRCIGTALWTIEPEPGFCDEHVYQIYQLDMVIPETGKTCRGHSYRLSKIQDLRLNKS